MTTPPPRPQPTLASPRTVPVVCAALVGAGFVAIALAWRGAAATLAVPLQTPHAVSGGLAGVGLIVFGMGIAYVHLARVAAAHEADAIDDINRTLARAGTGIVLTAGRAAAQPARRRRRRSRLRRL